MEGRITKLEWAVAGSTAIVLAGLVVAEPGVVEAPFENGRTLAFTVGGTALAAVVLTIMLRLRVPPVARILILGVPFVTVTWWLVSPFFVDDVVDETFTTSIADARAAEPAEPTAPALLGAGRFVGLAGHRGTGDAALFALADGNRVLRLENLDIQNGPDLRLYVVPGTGRTSPTDGSLYLGGLRGNVGNLNYDVPASFALSPGDWTVLVWCEAFHVEFVGATLTVT